MKRYCTYSGSQGDLLVVNKNDDKFEIRKFNQALKDNYEKKSHRYETNITKFYKEHNKCNKSIKSIKTEYIRKTQVPSNFNNGKLKLKNEHNINDILRPSKLILLNENEIIFEGELSHYNPKNEIQYKSKWCQITRNHFIYFDTEVSAIRYEERPNMIIDLKTIKTVETIPFPFSSSGNEKRFKMNYIKKKNCMYHMVFIFKNDTMNISDLSENISTISYINESKIEDEKMCKKINKCEESEHLSEINDLKLLIDILDPKEKIISKKEIQLEYKKQTIDSRKSFNNPYRKKPNKIPKTKSVLIPGKSNHLEKKCNTKELETESYRDRLIFGTKSKEQCSRWVYILNWLLSKYY